MTLEECEKALKEECGLCACGYDMQWDEEDQIFMHFHPGSGFIDSCSASDELQLQYVNLLCA